jgi:hypothetical protein
MKANPWIGWVGPSVLGKAHVRQVVRYVGRELRDMDPPELRRTFWPGWLSPLPTVPVGMGPLDTVISY